MCNSDKTYLPYVLDNLIKLKDFVDGDKPSCLFNTDSGICIIIDITMDRIKAAIPPSERPEVYTSLKDILIPYFKSWEHFSGNDTFPVPGPGNLPAHHAYRQAERKRELWRPDRPYGKKRRELLDYLITRISQDLKTTATATPPGWRNPPARSDRQPEA